MNNRDYQIVHKILLEIAIIEGLIEGFDLEKFISDERTKRAVCMTLIIVWQNVDEDYLLVLLVLIY